MNSILEIIHQVIANLVRKFYSQNIYLQEDDPWSGILVDTNFAVLTAYHNTLPSTPGQQIFGRDMILNNPFIADWGALGYVKQTNRQKQPTQQ